MTKTCPSSWLPGWSLIERSLIHGFPPKVIWLQCGNTSTDFVASLLLAHAAAIRAFIQDADSACIELY